MAIIPVIISSGGGSLAPIGALIGVLLAIGLIELFDPVLIKKKYKPSKEELKRLAELKKYEEEFFLSVFADEAEEDKRMEELSEQLAKKLQEREQK